MNGPSTYTNLEKLDDYSLSFNVERMIKIARIITGIFFLFDIIDWTSEGEGYTQNLLEKFSITFMWIAPIAIVLNKSRYRKLLENYCQKKKDENESFFIIASGQRFRKFRRFLEGNFTVEAVSYIPAVQMHKYKLSVIPADSRR